MTEQPKKILIIEDEKPLLQALLDKFSREKFVVYGAADGEEGLAAAQRLKPDLILLDIIMPKMDGMTMLRKMREQPWGKDTKVILLTNLSDFDFVADAIQQKAFDFLVKTDWTLESVVERVRERLGAA